MRDLKHLSETELADEFSASLSEMAESKQKSKLQQIAHDLQTHQIELEMQNRQLIEAQQQLEEARDRYSDLYDFAPVSYVTFNEKGVIKRINLTGAAMLGQVRTRLIEKPFSNFLTRDSYSIFFRHLRKALQSDLKVIDEIKINGANKQVLDVRIESVRAKGEENNTYLCHSAVLDITENNKIKNELLLQARQLRLVTDALPVLVAYINRDERHLFVNKAYASWFGPAPEEMIGKSAREIWGEKNYLAVRQYLNVAISGTPVIFDMELPASEGKKKYINTTFIPDFDDNNQVCGVIALIGDITDRLAIEAIDRKRLLNVAHFSRLSAMGEMASEIAHELNQPLAAISIFSSACRRMLISGKGGKEKIINSLVEISGQAERAGMVIRSIREFASKKELQQNTIAINVLVKEALHLLAVEIRSRGARLKLKLAEALPIIQGDTILIEQVIFNLARNSLDAMEDIDAAERVLKIKTSLPRPDEVEVSIEDTGPGLSEEESENIFKPFYTTKKDGMGMGLKISQSIIEAHHGRLSAAPGNGRGTIFRFTLPVMTEENDDAT